MFFHRVRSEGLAAHSYLIGSQGVAAAVDPRRDVRVYLELAARRGARLTHVFETHRNEDFAVGSAELATATGAEVFHGGQLPFGYGSPLRDGQEFRLGSVLIRALHTPGHTEDSFSYAASDLSTGTGPVMVFSGDALFVGSVGRLDLFGGGGQETEAAAFLHDSIFERLLPLGDEVILCPAHGGGSVCGEGLAERELSTLGIERRQNPALRETDRRRWVERQAAVRMFRPAYFSRMEVLNLEGPPVRGGPPRPALLGPREFKGEMEDGAVVLDTRQPHSFAGAHLLGSYNVWLEGVAPYAGLVLPYDRPLLLVVDSKRGLKQAAASLFRLGYDDIRGCLASAQELPGVLATGLTDWYWRALPVETSGVLSVQGLRENLGRYHVLDVREPSEWAEGHLEGARHIYVGELERRLNEVPTDREVAVFCSIGHRSGLAASILQRAGFPRVSNVLGGFGAWRAAGYPVAQEP